MLLAVLFWPGQPEPAYQGKTLTEWLTVYQQHADGNHEQQQAIVAVRHIGTNALPVLTTLLNHESSQWREKVPRLLPKLFYSPNGYPLRRLLRDSREARAHQ